MRLHLTSITIWLLDGITCWCWLRKRSIWGIFLLSTMLRRRPNVVCEREACRLVTWLPHTSHCHFVSSSRGSFGNNEPSQFCIKHLSAASLEPPSCRWQVCFGLGLMGFWSSGQKTVFRRWFVFHPQDKIWVFTYWLVSNTKKKNRKQIRLEISPYIRNLPSKGVAW